MTPIQGKPVPSVRSVRVSRRTGKVLLALFVPVASLIGAWWAFISLIHTSHLIAQSPLDVFREVTSGDGAGSLRSELGRGLLTTLGHAGLGLATGVVAGCALAAVTTVSRICAAIIRPAAVGLRSIPIIAFAPLLTLIFDRGVFVVATIGGVVTVVPTLYYLLDGLRSVRPELVDVIRAGGGKTWQVFWSLVLSLRIAAPGALVGALLAEWLATGNGLGLEMVRGQASFDYGSVWAATFLVTIAGMALYGCCVVIEAKALYRWAPERLAGSDI
jgi:ABC-type nitrate/sulfonate/bicarbonate transport system permease component